MRTCLCVCVCVCVCLSVNAKRKKKKKTFKEKRRNVKALKLGKWHMNATDEAEHLTTFFFFKPSRMPAYKEPACNGQKAPMLT